MKKSSGSRQKIILFDIDYTLFNTDSYREKLYSLLCPSLGCDINSFYKIAKDAEKESKTSVGYFHPKHFLQNLLRSAKRPVTVEQLENIFWNGFFYDSSIYPEVVEVFNTLKEMHIKIGIFSTGDPFHQRQKIASISHFIKHENIHIFTNKIPELITVLQGYKAYKVFVADDLRIVLSAIEKFDKNITTIWVKHTKKFEQSETIDNFQPDREISTISEIIEIIRGK